jgi:hypothetical protein
VAVSVSSRRRWWLVLLGSLVALVLALATLAPYLRDSAELVRLRNALLLDPVAADPDWTPERAPVDFVREHASPSTAFQSRVAALGLQALPDDWSRAQAIAQHLLQARQGRVGQPIQSDLETTYTRIRASGEGYCGDYADVFTAMALAAGLHVRSWAFSFDGFGGRGHIFNEVWDAGSRSWRMIDVFHNYRVSDASGRPLSALEFKERMRDDGTTVRFDTLEPTARPVFRHEERAREFYARGLGQWYLWWGNAVYTYDDAVLVRLLGPVSRAAEQLGGIAQNVHPRIRVLAEDGNAAMRDRMQRLKRQLLLVSAVVAAALVLALASASALWRGRSVASPG